LFEQGEKKVAKISVDFGVELKKVIVTLRLNVVVYKTSNFKYIVNIVQTGGWV
jgi:hypothetical protein